MLLIYLKNAFIMKYIYQIQGSVLKTKTVA